MIRIALPLLIQLYVIGLLLVVAGVWMTSDWRRKRREKRALRYRLQCIICAFPFENRSDNPLPSCPKCGSLNERSERGRNNQPI